MPSLSRRAAKGLFAFAAGVAALTGGTANAQTDPFALPTTTTASAVPEAASSGPGLSEIEIDGRVNARLVELRGAGGALTIDADGARAAGLPVDAAASGQIRIDALKLYQWRFDPLRQRLVIKLFRNNDGPNLRDFANRDNQFAQRDTITALRVDYDMNAVFGRSGVSVAGIGSAALVKGDFAAVTTARVAMESTGRPARVQRLDSFVQMRLPRSSAVATAGDFISAGSASQRPLRMGGVQIASDYSQQPDLVTSPMPAFSGSVAVPTTLDILTADQRFQLGKLEPGDFTVRNIPLNPGRGSMSVLLKDSLGREVVRNVSFYLSNTLLRPGLESFAVNAGFVRRRYGIEGDNYGPLAASAYYRRGLSPFLTLEASAESSAGLLNFGSRADFTVGNVALSSVELRTSRDSAIGTGNLLNASVESIGRGVSGRVGVSLPTANYRDVASHLGDRPPPKQFFANIAFDLRRSMPLQLSYVRQDYVITPGEAGFARRNELLSANLFYSPSSTINFSLNGGFRQTQTRSFFVTAGVSIRLGPRHAVSASGSEGAGQTSATLAYQYNDHQNSGLRAQATVGVLEKAGRITASAIHEGRWTTLNGGVVAAGGQVAGQVSATGTLIATGGTVYARGQSNNGYALVRAGDVEGIPVKLEHRFVGKTDRHGRLLVQNLRTAIPQRIDVDGTQLPADAVVLTSRHVISVPTRAIGLVDIDAMYYRPVVLQIVDQMGVAIEAGLPAIASPSGRETMVGFDGTVEFNTASGDRALLVKSAGGDCRVVIPDDAQLDAPGQPLVCQAIAQIAEAERSADSREGAKVARRN
jgi:outer membrane usher protein